MQILKKIVSRQINFLLILYAVFFISAQIDAAREYQIKATFLFNFTQFVEWPAESFSSPQSPAVIGILGKDPFGQYLEQAITGESLNKHPLIIKRFNSVEEINNCHILFIGPGKNKTEDVLQKLKGKSILTVSDAGSFTKLGGMIRLYTKNDKINIQINLEAAKAENLAISSKLLKLAEIVKTDKK